MIFMGIPSRFSGSAPSPAFLDVDAPRVVQSQMGRDVEFLKLQVARDREEKEFKKQIQSLKTENQRLRSKVDAGEKVSREEEPRFFTPEEQTSKPNSGPEDKDADWLKRRGVEEAGGSKEADRLDHDRSPFLPEAAEFKTPKEADRPPRVKMDKGHEGSQRTYAGRGSSHGGELRVHDDYDGDFLIIKDLQKKVPKLERSRG